MSTDASPGKAAGETEAPMCRARDRLWVGYVGVSLAFVAAYAATAGHDLAQAIIFAGSNLAAVVAILVGIRMNRPARPGAWYLLAAGQVTYLVGNVWWYVVAAAEGRPSVFPSPATEIFLVSYLLSALALLQLVRARRAGGDWSALLDALIVTIAFSCANFALVVAPQLTTTQLSSYGQLLAGVYPFLDMIFLVLAARLFFGADRARGALTPLAAWAAALLVADLVYGLHQVKGVEQDGDWPFYGYLASFLFVGVAGLHPAMREIAAQREQPHVAGRVRLAALGLCGLVVPTLVVQSVRDGQRIEPIVLSCASAIMFIVLMLRVGDLLKKTVAAGRTEQERLQQFLEAIPIGVEVRDAATARPVYVNQVAGRILGYDPGRVDALADLPHLYAGDTGEPYAPERLPVNRARQGHVTTVDDIEVERDAQRRQLHVVATPIRDGEQVRYVLTAFADVTAERQMAEELRQLSVIDELTDVNNRRGFLLAARNELALAELARRPGVLLFIDVDGLKLINDTYGHSVGDHALRSASTLLRANTRRRDVLGRIGGDEFCVLLTETSVLSDVDVWAARLREQVVRHNATSRQPYRLALTVGATAFDHDTPHTIEELIDRADAAMYQARELDGDKDAERPVRILRPTTGTRTERTSGP
ncbi:sensor domain-containing diguanylate cyclase [Catellatospora vulcania]|uniref:sensor domain-containing diguanylate cyclase n=1 Tax=Catellatospora vulcania TaxID=1460450 RepID=UPI0012D45F49|nr:sensor domain-containing diguanylate cyclase [Catellatospora vulcania]